MARAKVLFQAETGFENVVLQTGIRKRRVPKIVNKLSLVFIRFMNAGEVGVGAVRRAAREGHDKISVTRRYGDECAARCASAGFTSV